MVGTSRKSSQPLIDAVEGAAEERLSQIGFKRRAQGIFTLDLGPDFLGWLGLNRAVGRGEGRLEVNPVVGVRWQSLERKLAELLEQKWHPYVPATISTHLGYLTPERKYIPWVFFEEERVPALVGRMADSVEEFGLPFVRSSASPSAMLERLATLDFTTADSRRYQLPTAYLITGDKDRGRRVLAEQLDALRSETHAGAGYFRKFAQRFAEVTEGDYRSLAEEL